ncbi:MAG: type VI secretion system baseplate subunit TssG, partial [Gemmatimonadaceae bacterium]|nr:type VI secretion system baseplate subunit TssG [Chitinophagaceae bacterium]
RDVVSSEIRDESGWQHSLNIHLSRSGLYDQLPEGLFFQPASRARSSVADLASDYKQNKKKESEIRRFFLPFENDFFLQRVQIEEEETALLEGLQSGILNEYFIKFWNLPDAVPRSLLAPLILLLPYAYKIAGDIRLTEQSLAQILKEKVKIRAGQTGVEQADAVNSLVMGEARLGLDMICGQEFFEDAPLFSIEIGPLKNSRIQDYLPKNNRYLLIETFKRFFVPAGVETTVNILVSKEKQQIKLSKGEEAVLGFSSYL